MTELKQRFEFRRKDILGLSNDDTFNNGVMFGWGSRDDAEFICHSFSKGHGYEYWAELADNQSPHENDLNLAELKKENADYFMRRNPIWGLQEQKMQTINYEEIKVLHKILGDTNINYESGLKEVESSKFNWVGSEFFWVQLKPLMEKGAALEKDLQGAFKINGVYAKAEAEDNKKDYPLPLLSKETQLRENTNQLVSFISQYKSDFPLAVFNHEAPKEHQFKEVVFTDSREDAEVLHKATGRPAYAASGYDRKKAAEMLREQLPNAQITICSTNSHFSPENQPLSDCIEIAESIKGAVAIPNFTRKEMKNIQTTFADLNRSRGKGAHQVIKESVQNPIVNYGDKYRQPKSKEQILEQAKKPTSCGIFR